MLGQAHQCRTRPAELAHVDGSRTEIDLFSVNENWQHTIHFRGCDGKGKLVYGAMAKFSTEEIRILTELLAVKDPRLVNDSSGTGLN